VGAFVPWAAGGMRDATTGEGTPSPRVLYGPPAPALVHTVNRGSDGPRCAGIEGGAGRSVARRFSTGPFSAIQRERRPPAPPFQKQGVKLLLARLSAAVSALEKRGNAKVLGQLFIDHRTSRYRVAQVQKLQIGCSFQSRAASGICRGPVN
jgi:hypothetical protein